MDTVSSLTGLIINGSKVKFTEVQPKSVMKNMQEKSI